MAKAKATQPKTTGPRLVAVSDDLSDYLDEDIEAPPHLSPDAAAWVRSIHAEHDLPLQDQLVLVAAAEAWDRLQQAREALAIHGTTYLDRFDAPRLRPEVAVERDSRLSFARLIRQLDLDPPEPFRRGFGWRGDEH